MTRPCSLPGAPGPLLVTLLVASLAPALAACGAATRDAVLSCTVAADCGAGARCVAGACQASSPPVADFTAPTGLTTNRPVTVTATAQDADPGDAIAAWTWSIAPLSAACAADADVADTATLQAVFWCAGTYQLTLVVTDAVGAESEPVRRTVTVAALPDAPTVSAGPPAMVEHQCRGAPLRCELEQPVGLTALGQSPLGGALAYRWSAIPPDPSRAGATALLSPAATSRDPALAIETSGGPISGTWQLRVRVQDASGNLAQATQLVTVGNRPPAIDETLLSIDHAYQAGVYRAGGTLAVPLVDPDGDPLVAGIELAEPAASGCAGSFSAGAGASGVLSLSCPAPAGLQVARSLHVSATDVNGAGASAQVPLLVRNRLPVLRPAGGATVLELDHTVGTCPGGAGSCFQVTGLQVAGVGPFLVEDPDQDPVSPITLVPLVDPDRTASTGEAGADGRFRFSTPVDRPAEFRAADGTSGFALTATAADPFGASAPAAPLTVRILNRPPVVTGATPALTTGHHYDAGLLRYQASGQLATFEDPDGDPLLDAGSGGDESCGTVSLVAGVASVECLRAFSPAAAAYPTLSGFVGTHTVAAVVGDGWATARATTAITIASAPPTVPDYTGAIEACLCDCAQWEVETPGVCAVEPAWRADSRGGTFPVVPADADGDPLAVTFTSSASVTPQSTVNLPALCTATVSATSFPASVQVRVNDGVSQASGTWTVTRVVCAKAGQPCTLPPGAGVVWTPSKP